MTQHLTEPVSPVTSRASLQAVRVVPKTDRRNVADRHLLLARVQHEFHEIPGLCLTADQAARFLSLPRDVCKRVLESLVDGELLQRCGEYYGHFRKEFVGSGFLSGPEH